MEGDSNPRINIGVDRLPSKPLGQMHYISRLIETAFIPFILFQIRHALLEGCLPWRTDEDRRSLPEPSAETIPLTL